MCVTRSQRGPTVADRPQNYDCLHTQNLSLINLSFRNFVILYTKQRTIPELSPVYTVGYHELLIMTNTVQPQDFWNFWVAQELTYIRCDRIFLVTKLISRVLFPATNVQ